MAHPGQYAATQLQLPPEVGRNSAGHLRMIELSYAMLRGYGLDEPALTDAIRFVRSTLHGFAASRRPRGSGIPATSTRPGVESSTPSTRHSSNWPIEAGATVNSNDQEV